MDLQQQLIFLFSALGGFNGLFLSLYFAFFSKQKKSSNYFLSALLLVLSIRIIKSVFFYFNNDLSQIFIQTGLSACVLIGPFLYLYLIAAFRKKTSKNWWLHVVPVAIIVIALSYAYPYWEYRRIWAMFIVKGIYVQWLIYILLSGILLKPILKKLFVCDSKLKDVEVWMISIFIGITLIWLGYNIGSYTSYIVGAVSFSFVFYLLVLFWVFKRKKYTMFFDDPVKYANKRIEDVEAIAFQKQLHHLVTERQLYKNSNIKLSDIAKQLQVPPHYLSQFLNDNLGKSFSLFINEYRIEEAKRLLSGKSKYTTEAIGYECGFNSKSTFFTTFKKIAGVTPAQFKNAQS